MTMTHNEIRAAIAASPELLALAAPGVRADGEIARRLSEQQQPRIVQPTLVGEGTVSDKIGLPNGPVFVRSLRLAAEAALPEAASAEQVAQKALLEQAWRLLQAGRLDVGLPSVRAGIGAMVGQMPGLTAEGAARVLAVAEVPDAVTVDAVSAAQGG